MAKKKFWNFIKNKEDNTGDLQIYGEISDSSWWGDEVTPKEFKADLDALGDIDILNIYINSPGGDVFAGQSIHSMLKRHKATKNVYIDGLAASIASVIAMAGDKIIMPNNAMMMIHNPWTIAMGNANDFRKMAGELDKISETLIAAYQGKAKDLEKDKLVELMDAETWLTAEEAKSYGLIDEIEEPKQYAASLKGRFLNLYKNIPEELTKQKEEAPKNNKEVELLKAKLALECEL